MMAQDVVLPQLQGPQVDPGLGLLSVWSSPHVRLTFKILQSLSTKKKKHKHKHKNVSFHSFH